jgi:hypothetical protein
MTATLVQEQRTEPIESAPSTVPMLAWLLPVLMSLVGWRFAFSFGNRSAVEVALVDPVLLILLVVSVSRTVLIGDRIRLSRPTLAVVAAIGALMISDPSWQQGLVALRWAGAIVVMLRVRSLVFANTWRAVVASVGIAALSQALLACVQAIRNETLGWAWMQEPSRVLFDGMMAPSGSVGSSRTLACLAVVFAAFLLSADQLRHRVRSPILTGIFGAGVIVGLSFSVPALIGSALLIVTAVAPATRRRVVFPVLTFVSSLGCCVVFRWSSWRAAFDNAGASLDGGLFYLSENVGAVSTLILLVLVGSALSVAIRAGRWPVSTIVVVTVLTLLDASLLNGPQLLWLGLIVGTSLGVADVLQKRRRPAA